MRINYLSAVLGLIVAALLGVGILMIYSSSTVYARDNCGDSYFYVKRQLIWGVAGMASCLILRRLDYHFFRRRSRLLILFGIIILAAVLVPGLGRTGGGARRWLYLGGVGFQPSELVKYLLIIYLADLLSRHQDRIRSFLSGFLPALAATALPAVLVVLQPDLGSAVSMAAIGMLMLFLAGARPRHLVIPVAAALPALVILVARVGYRKQRILAFLNPWADPRGSGFQIIQSLIALGSGGVTGLGLGESRQKLFYLPAATTDFIFSILGEELGFVGAGSVVLLVAGLTVTGFFIARRAPDLFGFLLASGITAMLSLQALVNMGVSSGLLPTKGLPLPFVSYGGSNLVVSFAAVGILLNISAHQGGESVRERRREGSYNFNRNLNTGSNGYGGKRVPV